MGTAYQFYGVKECTEPATALDEKTFVRRLFSDASAGAAQFFTYEFPQHAPDIHKYIRLITRQTGRNADRRLLSDDALPPRRRFAAYHPSQPLPPRFVRLRCAGRSAYRSTTPSTPKAIGHSSFFKPRSWTNPFSINSPTFNGTADGLSSSATRQSRMLKGRHGWLPAKVERVGKSAKYQIRLQELAAKIAGINGVDGKLDGVWTTRRGKQVFAFNAGDKTSHRRNRWSSRANRAERNLHQS